MTRRGVRIGTVAGIPVRVGASWLVIVPLVGIALFARIQPGLGTMWERVVVAAAGTVLMFASVLVHELGHAVVARRRGIAVDRVVVFLFGGYSEMNLESAAPADDMAISFAGPVASGMLALLTVLAAWASPEWAGMRGTLALLGLVNIGVALFNLLPGFPLDGGRIVRAGLVGGGVDRRRAEMITARLGMGLGLAGLGLGLWSSTRGEPASIVAVPGGSLLVVIAAAAHPRRVERVGHLMRPAPQPVGESESTAALAGREDEGPIPVVEAGRVVGFIRPGAPGRLVGDGMDQVSPEDVVDVGDPAAAALARIAATGRPVAVLHRGRLVGILDAPPRGISPPPQR